MLANHIRLTCGRRQWAMPAQTRDDGERIATRDLTRGPIGTTLLAFALPILAGNVLQSLNGSINAIWIGRFLGEEALAAAANANNIMFFLLGAVFGVGMAATILVGQAMGRHDPAGAKRVIGTATTFFLGVSVLVVWLHRHERGLYRPDPEILKALIVKGVPMGLQMVLVSLAMIMMISMVNRHGIEWTSAYGAALQLWNYVQMPAMAIGAACSSMAAQNVGAGNWDRVDGTARTGTLFNYLLTGALVTALLLLDRFTLGLFLPEESPVLANARHLNHIALWSFLFFGVNFVIAGVVRATGAVLAPLLILALALWGIRIPFASLMQPVLGVDAIWWSFPLGALSAMLMSAAYYRWGNWRKARMLASTPAPSVDIDAIAVPAEVPTPSTGPVADCCPRTSPHRHLPDGSVQAATA